MAITQPSYPAETNEVVTHVGAYIDAREVVLDGRLDTLEAAETVATHKADTTTVHGIADTTAVPVTNIFNGATFPARPTATVVLWIGGGGADDPTADMDDGDIWFPSEA